MQHQEFSPPEALSDAIKCFWYNRKAFGEKHFEFEVVPDGYAEIIFHFGKLSRIGEFGTLQPLPSPFMMGLLDHPVRFHAESSLEIIAIRCFPWTVFDLLGLPTNADGVRLFEHPIVQLQPILNNLVQAGKIEQAITELKTYFLNARLHVAPNSLLHKAGSAMRQANGTLPVSQVAGAAHATLRTLERNFKQSSGHTVKDVSALIRFEQARNHLWHSADINLAALAHELGYTDQSHLSREFKRYSGTTPAAFVREAKKRKQATGTEFVVFVQS